MYWVVGNLSFIQCMGVHTATEDSVIVVWRNVLFLTSGAKHSKTRETALFYTMYRTISALNSHEIFQCVINENFS